MSQPTTKPHLSLSKILQMNLGFLGLQFSFGLQQGNMAPIYSYLGADEASLPILQLAGPVTGLVVQPIIGAMSDRTNSKWGRRTPYFIVGAILCSLGLLFMPLSQSILMAASLLWILDAGNNITMEPYRAYVSDRLNEDQHNVGFLTQSAFTGLAQCLALGTPALLVGLFGMNKDAIGANNIPDTVYVVFTIGAVLSLSTILWSVIRVPELPLTESQKAEIAAQPKTASATFREIGSAIVEMPRPMRKLGVMMLFQWYAMGIYWTYVTYSIARSVYNTSEPVSDGFRSAVLTNGTMAAFYNAVAFVAALLMMPMIRKIGARKVHAAALVAGGLGMMAIPQMTDTAMLFPAAIGVGICWGSIMGTPYVMLASCIPPRRTGVYMGIFNMMIVIPMLLNAATFPFYYEPWLGGDARNALVLAGVLLICAAFAVLRVKDSELGTA
ncbi:MFS transporter [Sphingorhabdus contaminans]|uniref:SLC45 family MFS transporter n=1 Tax=Sphingorhabdus contaminans TaxID=1343899 RepID=A0A553WB67_9SPHN|nr:MFS transporter [Sphingorhabdus contaminans]TSB01935.1 SLC45 family MFS transporter [Sphingorhabdus contaminans]